MINIPNDLVVSMCDRVVTFEEKNLNIDVYKEIKRLVDQGYLINILPEDLLKETRKLLGYQGFDVIPNPQNSYFPNGYYHIIWNEEKWRNKNGNVKIEKFYFPLVYFVGAS